MALFSTYNLEERNRIIYSLIIGMVYATSDEIHQKFIEGRSGQITDVMIDSMGVLFGILIVMLLIEIYIKIYKNIKKYWNLYLNVV